METSMIEVPHIKVYLLVLNPMNGPTEGATLVACSDDLTRLMTLYESQKAPERWSDPRNGNHYASFGDGSWSKIFKKDSRLEWFNPIESSGYIQAPVQEEWIPEKDFHNIVKLRDDFITEDMISEIISHKNSD